MQTKIEPLSGKVVEAYISTAFEGGHAVLNTRAWVEDGEGNTVVATGPLLMDVRTPYWFLVTYCPLTVPQVRLFKTRHGALRALRTYAKDRDMVKVA